MPPPQAMGEHRSLQSTGKHVCADVSSKHPPDQALASRKHFQTGESWQSATQNMVTKGENEKSRRVDKAKKVDVVQKSAQWKVPVPGGPEGVDTMSSCTSQMQMGHAKQSRIKAKTRRTHEPECTTFTFVTRVCQRVLSPTVA